MNKYVFIVGTGRTGSTFLADFFSANQPRCLGVHEPRRTIKLMSNAFLSHRIGVERMRTYIRAHAVRVDRILAARGCDTYVQCDPWLYGFMPWLDEAFGSPYVVHVVRHPFTHIPSHLNRWYREAWTGFLRNVIPFWRLRADLAGDMDRRRWRTMTEVERVAWYWAKINGLISAGSAGLGNYTRIRYEDLFSPGKDGMEQLCAFCGLGVAPGKARLAGLDRNIARQRFGAASTWPPEIRQSVLDTCRPLMEEYGYPVP